MKLQVKNKQLHSLQAILERLQARTMRANRGRLKLFQRVSEKFAEYASDELAIIKQYAKLAEDGTIQEADGQILLEDPSKTAEINGHLQELAEELVTIDGGEYRDRLQAFFFYLSEAEEEFTIAELDIVDQLLEQIEKGENHD